MVFGAGASLRLCSLPMLGFCLVEVGGGLVSEELLLLLLVVEVDEWEGGRR